MMARVLYLFLLIIFSGQSWGLVVTPEDNIYRYDGGQVTTDRQNYDYGVALNLQVSSIKHLLGSPDNAEGGSFFAFVDGFLVPKGGMQANKARGDVFEDDLPDVLGRKQYAYH